MLAAVALYASCLVLVYWDTVASMVSIWYRSETFAHGFVILPVTLWLVWRKRTELLQIAPLPMQSLLPVIVVAAAGAVWLLGDFADVLALKHFAWITLLIGGVWWIVGDDVAREIAFPLGFLYFAVPFGEFLTPPLIEWTADFTITALRASGVPVWRDGMTFQIPTGAWSVVEACSGLRYLIASVTVGALYAYLSYRSPLRRLLFVVTATIVPILANWLRAYSIVMIGHLSGNQLAVGIDHIIYGWVFFGVVMGLLFWAGSFWREDDKPSHPVRDSAGARATRRLFWPARRLNGAAGIALLAAAIAPAMLHVLTSSKGGVGVDASAPALQQWRPVAGSLVDWKPEFLVPRAAISSTYARDADRAAMYVGMYYNQGEDSKLVSSENQLIRTTSKAGYLVSERRRVLDAAGAPLAVRESVLRVGAERVLARTWYWIDGKATASEVEAKLLQVRARLMGRGDRGAIVVVYVVLPPEGPAVSAVLDDLTRDAAATLPGILARRLHGGSTG